ncbi:type III secretion system translocon subunit SctE [Robbsia sp. KACC 23696]|uniref:type III secretion system translocon subunit SctE n=1 Tax=Robbsia sp. KACC 23696 TaxID=3149231 RepID=UPI00325A9CDB
MSDTALPPDGIRPPLSGAMGDDPGGIAAAPPGTGRGAVDPNKGAATATGALGVGGGADQAIDPLRAVRDFLRASGLPDGAGGGGDDGNGAPALAPSLLTGNTEDLAIAMQLMQASFSNAQADTTMGDIKNNAVKLKASQAEQNANYKKSVESAREAEAQSGGILGFFKKLFKIVAAVAAVVLSALAVAATAGAAAPLLAFAVAGTVGAVIGLVSEISQLAGGPAISISGLLTKMGTALVKACGGSDKEAEQLGKVVGNGIGFLLGAVDPSVLGELVGGIAAVSGASPNVIAIVTVVATLATVVVTALATGAMFKGAESATKLAGTLAKMSGLKYGLTVTKGVAEGSSSVIAGTQGIIVAKHQLDADQARADAKASSVKTLKLQQQMDDLLDDIRKMFEDVEESYRGASQMLGRASQSYQLLARNMGGRVGA